jgi:hypothetical protein
LPIFLSTCAARTLSLIADFPVHPRGRNPPGYCRIPDNAITWGQLHEEAEALAADLRELLN